MSRQPSSGFIQLRGVRHNNLKGFDLDLPLHRLIVVTGLSGSGKSSLAFDTLYAEGQRRYIETFSPYARQFFDRMDKPRVDRISGIPPAIAIEQRNAVRSTRSTIGTMTEICDYLKVLWPRLAQLHCRQCGQPVRKESPPHIWQTLSSSKAPGKEIEVENEGRGRTETREVLITFSVPLSEKLPLQESLGLIAKQGFQRLLIEGEIIRIDEAADHSALRVPRSALTVVQDRLKLTPANRARFVEACEQAYHFGKGKLAIHEFDATAPRSAFRAPRLFSQGFHCAACDLDYREPSPALFSFNHPIGACANCKGFGRIISMDYDLALPDRRKTLAEGAVRPWQTGFSAECQTDLLKFCKLRKVPTKVPFNELPADQQDWVINGDPGYGTDKDLEWPRAWYGVKGYFRWLESKSYKMHVRVLLSRYRAYTPCPECHGQRLNQDALLYQLTNCDSRLTSEAAKHSATRKSDIVNRKLNLADFYALPVTNAIELLDALTATPDPKPKTQDPITHALREVRSRLQYLADVGLGYLTLDRPTRTLSGGETERVNLTTCLGTKLVNTLYVLDEPSVGLHPRDTARLIGLLEQLRHQRNTVVVVEHEASVMRAADQIIDLGPGHGATGGELVFQGTFRDIRKSKGSLTGQYLSGRKRIELPERRSVGVMESWSDDSQPSVKTDSPPLHHSTTPLLSLRHATRHNLKDVSVTIPLNRFIVVTGVSGSGKTTLIRDLLLPALEVALQAPPVGRASPRTASDDSKDTEHADATETEPATRNTCQISGTQHLARVLMVDQSALGKTPRSNPAVYTGAFEHIREVFAQSETAKQRGLNASAFSFNSAVGQCERCRGAGFEKIEMQFLSDVFIRCPDCNGRRYRAHILEVALECGDLSPLSQNDSAVSERAKGQRLLKSGVKPPHSKARCPAWSIADALEASVDEAVDFFGGFIASKPAHRAIAALKLLQDVGLGYLQLGQPINTLSGGECQRLKLAAHLAEAVAAGIPACRGAGASSPAEEGDDSSKDHDNSLVSSATSPNPGGKMPPSTAAKMAAATLFIFDEPTTGLHFDDVRVLLQVFQRLVDAGHSVLVIEHNLDVIKCADWVIDLGPEAGADGGQIVVTGTPEDIAQCKTSHTGRFLHELVAADVRRLTSKPLKQGARA